MTEENSALPPVNLDFKALLKQFQQMQEQVGRSEFIRKNYIEIASKMDSARQAIFRACKELEDLAQQIDPAIVLNKPTRGKKHRMEKSVHEDIIRNLHAKLTNGTHITVNLIRQMYPDMTMNQLQGMMNRLKKMNGVQIAKDGRNVRLYC